MYRTKTVENRVWYIKHWHYHQSTSTTHEYISTLNQVYEIAIILKHDMFNEDQSILFMYCKFYLTQHKNREEIQI